MMMRVRCLGFWVFSILVLLPQIGQAAKEHLDDERPEAWAMAYFTSLSLFPGFGAPYSREPGSIEGGVEVGWVPVLGKAKRKVGFNGVKEEDLNKAPIFGRPRVTVGLPWKVALSLSYLPPIRLFGVKPHLFAFAVERPLFERRPWMVGVRAYGQIGQVEGAFTCPGDVAKFPPGSPQNPFGCNRKSADTATLHYGGFALSGAYRLESLGGLTPYLTLAGNYLDTKFQVKAQTFGARDRSRRFADMWTFSLSGGVVYPLTERLNLSLGALYSPLTVKRPPSTFSTHDDFFNVRAEISYRFR